MKLVTLSLMLVMNYLLTSQSFAADYKVTGRAKAFLGPEGEVITLVPVNDTQVILYAHNTYGIYDERSMVYDERNRTVGCPTGSLADTDPLRALRTVMMVDHKGYRNYLDVTNSALNRVQNYALVYSPELSEKIQIDKILKKAEPCSLSRDLETLSAQSPKSTVIYRGADHS